MNMEKLKLKIELQKLKKSLIFQAYIDKTSNTSLTINDIQKGIKKVVEGVEVIYEICDKNTKYGNRRKSRIHIESFKENKQLITERYSGLGGSSYQNHKIHKIKISMDIDRAMDNRKANTHIMYGSDIHSVIPEPHKESVYILTKNNEVRDKIYSLISKSLK